MHDVNELLEQDEVAWDDPDTRTNQDAVELPPLELRGDYRLSSLTKVGETMKRVIAEILQPFLGGGESRQYLCGGHAGKPGIVGIREINQFGVQPDNQSAPPGRPIGALRLVNFSVHIQSQLLPGVEECTQRHLTWQPGDRRCQPVLGIGNHFSHFSQCFEPARRAGFAWSEVLGDVSTELVNITARHMSTS